MIGAAEGNEKATLETSKVFSLELSDTLKNLPYYKVFKKLKKDRETPELKVAEVIDWIPAKFESVRVSSLMVGYLTADVQVGV